MPQDHGIDRKTLNQTFTLSADEKRLAASVGMSEEAAKREIFYNRRQLDALRDSFTPRRTSLNKLDFD